MECYCCDQTNPIRGLMRSHGGFDLVVDRLVSCCRLLLACNVDSLTVVPLDGGSGTLHLHCLSLSDCVSLVW